MLVAKNQYHESISLINFSKEGIQKLKNTAFYCPICKQSVIIKNGYKNISHFAHERVQQCPNSSNGESAEHIYLKRILAQWCKKNGINYQLEAFLTIINQRPDLLIGKMAIEIQCSPIGIDRLMVRTKNYLANGYYPVWICGSKLTPKHKLSELSKRMCSFSRSLGFYLWVIDWQEGSLALWYHIEEDWSKKIYYEVKRWGFFQENLTTIFQFPQEYLINHQRTYDSAKLMVSYYQSLKRKLIWKDPEIIRLQGELYTQSLHLLYLPYWFYFPGSQFIFCQKSDIFLKVKIYHVIDKFQQSTFRLQQLFHEIYEEMNRQQHLLVAFPLIPMSVLLEYGSWAFIRIFIQGQVICATSPTWKVNADWLNEWKEDNNKIPLRFKTATYSKSMLI